MSEAIPAATPEKLAATAAPSIKAILALKIGMTRVYDAHGKSIPVTVLQAGPCPVTQVLTSEKNGYSAIQVAFGEVREKSVNKPRPGILKRPMLLQRSGSENFARIRQNHFRLDRRSKWTLLPPEIMSMFSGLPKGKVSRAP